MGFGIDILCIMLNNCGRSTVIAKVWVDTRMESADCDLRWGLPEPIPYALYIIISEDLQSA